ncbi:MAG: DnaJ domain-containing protein [Elioraea sp.]|nr:DnaJ domain-containing protein [Elioraea sp.]
MTWFLAGVAAVGLLLWSAHAFANARIETIKAILKWLAIGLGIALALLLVFTGKGGQFLFLGAVLAPLLIRLWNQWQASRTFGAGSQREARASEVETATLRMRLDHDTGTMSGMVLRGPYKGRELAELALADLIALWLDCRAEDPESVPLLEAWLDRAFGEAWRDAAEDAAGEERGSSRRSQTASGGPMTREEAYAILGLKPGATEEEIRAAHRRLMQTAHPDRGGSDWLAARINQARDVLLGG